MEPSPINPYAAPANVSTDIHEWRSIRKYPILLRIACAASLLGYIGITVLLLTSTPSDRFYGYFFLPVATLFTVLVIQDYRQGSSPHYVAVLTCVSQFLLCGWLTWTHGMKNATIYFAIVPSIVIFALAIAYAALRK